MKLTADQLSFYRDNGFLQLDNYFSDAEIGILKAEIPNTIEERSPRIILENNGSIRSIFAPHFINPTFDRLSRLDRMVIPAEQMIGSSVYIHQYKINVKKGLQSDWWEWHQDFPYWHIDDGIDKPDMVTVMLYLEDTNYLNGALLLIPQTHKLGIVQFQNKRLAHSENGGDSQDVHKPEYMSSLDSNIKFSVDHELVRSQSVEHGIVTASAGKGSVLFFHGNIFHASNSNLTAFDRNSVLITYNSVNNRPAESTKARPDFLASRKCDAITEIEQDI